MSIIDKIEKNIKSFLGSRWFDEVFWFLVVIFVALTSFSFGVRYEQERYLRAHPVHIERSNVIQKAWEAYKKQARSQAEFFASQKGSVFYPLGCPSGKSIDEEKRVYFRTKGEALDAGYRPSSRCF